MNSLRVKVELILFIAVMLIVGLSYGIQRYIILPSLNPYEVEAAQENMSRGVNALEMEEARLAEISQRLASDETIQTFAAAPTTVEAPVALRPAAMDAAEIDLLWLVREEGNVIYGRSLDPADRGELQLQELPVAAWPVTHPLLLEDDEATESGAFLTDAGPALVASHLLQTPDGERLGTLITGRLLDQRFLSEIYRETLISFRMWPAHDAAVRDKAQVLSRMTSGEGSRYTVEEVSDELFFVYASYPGVEGKTVLILRSDTQRNVLARAYDTLQESLLALLAVGLLALVILIVLFRIIVLNPISKMTQHTIAMKQSNDLSQRLDLKRDDEIGVLANEFNRMVEQVDEDRRAQQRAEEALRASEERYALAVQGANDGLWDWNLQTNDIHFSHRWKQMLGYEESEIGNNPDAEWFARVHPDDLENVRTALDAHLKDSTEHFESEHRILHKDESWLWVLCRGLAVRDENGRPARMAGSQTDITPRKIIEEQLTHQALHDSLTTLPNRALFLDRLGQAMKYARRNKDYIFAVLYMDVDRFKVINDGLGHMVGDMLLTSIADQLSETLRSSDTVTRHGGTVARFGGDEFVLLVDNLNDLGDATIVAERVLSIFEKPFHVAGHEIFTSTSLGIALSSTQYRDQEEMLRSADTAMYRAKALGKARYEVFDTDMQDKAMARLNLENDLRRALEREEFIVYYQPIVAFKSGGISAFEALVRWQHPDRGLLSPVEFVPVAEETGMIVQMGTQVITEATRQARQWQIKIPAAENIMISVNLSVKDFSPTLVQEVESILMKSGLSPRSLKLEITESAIMESVDTAIHTLTLFREMGAQVALDDFGTGYSSLSYLNRFPTSTLKIDRAFVRDMDTSSDSLQIVKTIILLAHALEMDVIAEGIESQRHFDLLQDLGCEYGQGYFFSPPVSAKEASKMLTSNLVWRRSEPGAAIPTKAAATKETHKLGTGGKPDA